MKPFALEAYDAIELNLPELENAEGRKRFTLPKRVQKSNKDIPVREWIPGVSTPTGVMLATGAVAIASTSVAPLIVKAVNIAGVAFITGTTTAFPGVALWFGMNQTGL